MPSLRQLLDWIELVFGIGIRDRIPMEMDLQFLLLALNSFQTNRSLEFKLYFDWRN